MASVLLIREFLLVALQRTDQTTLAPGNAVPPSLALWGVALLLAGSYAGASVLSYDNQVVGQRVVKVVELAIMDRLVRHLLTLSVGFFDRTSHGDLIQAIRHDVAGLRLIVMSYATILMEGTVTLGLLGAAFWMSPRLSFWVLLILPLACLPIVRVARRTHARSFIERRTGYVVFDVLLQIFRGIRTIKAYQGEAQEVRTTIDKAERYLDEQIRIVQIREMSGVVLESLGGLSIAAVIIVGGLEVMHGLLDWPALLAFLMAVRAVHGPLDHVNTNLMQIQRYGAAAHRITELLAEQPEVRDRLDARPFRYPPRSITVDDVSFSYGNGLVLQGISVEAKAGETIGIAGPSGSGKTTLLSLLARFYDPTAGTIRFDGVDLRELSLADLYRQLAIVTQEPFLFETTVRENIRCGRPDATDPEVDHAARLAEIHDEIASLPEGYETVLGTVGRRLSGGQAQRVNVARAIVKNPPLLLLDEATSSLDSVAEAKVQRAIDRLMEGRTSFIAAHRLSTLRHADRIIVLDRGRCVGLGTHEELLRDCLLYREMWAAQRFGEPVVPRLAPAEPESPGDDLDDDFVLTQQNRGRY